VNEGGREWRPARRITTRWFAGKEGRTLKGNQELQTINVDLPAGSTLGDYQIERLLGRGQFSMVYAGRQPSQARAVMITTFSFPEEVSHKERHQLTSRIDRERAALARLTHPHILPMYDVGEQPGYLYLVTACIEGASLDQVLKQQRRLTPQQTLDVLRQLGAGLDFAHSQGVLHGALSLSNALVSDELTVYIAGFGLRTILEAYTNTTQNAQLRVGLLNAHGTLLGNPAYASPEQVLGYDNDSSQIGLFDIT
jgi:serine/threonine protein kinase